MNEVHLGIMEAKFAEIVWSNAPISSKDLVHLCEQQLNWKRTTTYTVLKKLCERGIFQMKDSQITVLITKEEFDSIQSEQFVENNFSGSLPSFIAAFTARKKLSKKEIERIRTLIDEIGKEEENDHDLS